MESVKLSDVSERMKKNGVSYYTLRNRLRKGWTMDEAANTPPRGKSKTDLSRKQRRALFFIQGYIEEHGFSPTVRDLQGHFKYKSSAPAKNMIDFLEMKGWISKEPKKSRTIRILKRLDSVEVG